MTRTMATVDVSEIMTTKLRIMRADEAVSVAEWVMNLDEIQHVLAVDSEHKLVGIVSDRDILRVMHREDRIPLASIMSAPLHTVAPTTPVTEALEKLMEARVHALPVVDATNRPVGIVTTSDFLEVARWALRGLDASARRDSRDISGR